MIGQVAVYKNDAIAMQSRASDGSEDETVLLVFRGRSYDVIY